jgi:undecaprenyl-diphosphatase
MFFRRDGVRIVRGLLTSVRRREITTAGRRLAWLLIAATVPVGLAGLALDHAVRTALGRPAPAAIFLVLNGIMLWAVERVRSRRPVAVTAGPGVYVSAAARKHDDSAADARLARQSWAQALTIGAAQILALFPGISRSGATIGAGLLRGLSHDDAARFAFLLATPVIAAAGVLKLPELAGPSGRGVLGPVLAGSVVAGVAAYVSVRFLTRYFETRTLRPFAVYCVVAGLAGLAWFAIRG